MTFFSFYVYCVIPENIRTLPKEGYWEFPRALWSDKPKFAREKNFVGVGHGFKPEKKTHGTTHSHCCT